MKKETLKRFREHVKELLEIEGENSDLVISIEAVVDSSIKNQPVVSPIDLVDYIAILAEVHTAVRLASPAKKQREEIDEILDDVDRLEHAECDCGCDEKRPIAEDGLPETKFNHPHVFTKEYDDGQH